MFSNSTQHLFSNNTATTETNSEMNDFLNPTFILSAGLLGAGAIWCFSICVYACVKAVNKKQSQDTLSINTESQRNHFAVNCLSYFWHLQSCREVSENTSLLSRNYP